MLPVVIGSHPNSPWLTDCLESIQRTSHPDRIVTVHEHGGHEPHAIRAGLRYERFLFLQDSTQILHPDFWNTIDTLDRTWLFGHPPMFMGVYRSMDITELTTGPVDKETAINAETAWSHHLHYDHLWPYITDHTGTQETRHGRNNLVLGNHLIRKWKGTWRGY